MSQQETTDEPNWPGMAENVEFDQDDQDLFEALDRKASQMKVEDLTPFQARLLRDVLVLRAWVWDEWYQRADGKPQRQEFFRKMEQTAELVAQIAMKMDV